ncbi:hypothetical protein [Paraliomyxa miuraensis]|uniref:hypothetical protein n=1 Tax=Paraliomyxa miuraensis TaxID=376150 RepID=UPI00225677BF|nr:hypothetical protein [Paraliomyxa miuraensis]MCX4247033.1 hypothetical protein [Paraliomyxa miuraensis]
MSDRRYWLWALVVLVVGIALRVPAVWAGFGMDDFAQLAMLDDSYPVPRHPWDLFSFSKGDPAEVEILMSKGSLAWWSHPELKLCALRPLSSLLMWLDVQVFGHDAVGHHVHTLVWWSAMLVAAALLLRRLLPARWAALALLLYALDECHTYPIGWLANRNAIVSATFGFLALWAHVRHREDGWPRGRWLAAVLMVLALCGGEYALCIVPYFVVYELVAGPGTRAERARALLPLCSLLLGYVALHRAMGFGSFASSVYVDPAREPMAWLGVAAMRIPTLVADMALAIPTGRMTTIPGLIERQMQAGVVALMLGAVLLPGLRRRLDATGSKRVLWLSIAAVLAILPVASSFVSARLLLIPTLGGHVVVAALVLDGWDRLRDPALRLRLASLARGAVSAVLVIGHVGLAPWWGLEETFNIVHINLGTQQAARTMQVDDARVARQRLVVLSASDPMTLLYPHLVRWAEGHPLPRSWWVLSMAPRPHTLTRVSPDTIEMTVIGGAMLTGPVEQLFRRPEFPLRAGDLIRLEGLTIRILQVDADGRPFRVRFGFDVPVDDPSLVFLLATRKGMLHYPMGPVGATLPIPPAQLPMAADPG